MRQGFQAALRPKQAAEYVGISIATIWRWAKVRPDFPRPRKIGPNATVWMRDDLDSFLAQRAGGGHA